MSRLEHVRVLVVDADLVLAHDVANGLRAQGYVVRCAYGADAALSIAEEFKPHAFICEVVLPGMNGIDLANRFVDEYPECRVLLISGKESVVEVMENATLGGHCAFLRKPLDMFAIFEFLADSAAPSGPMSRDAAS